MYNSIINTKDQKDKSGLLGKALIETTEYTKVYTVFKEAKHANINVSIVNPNTIEVQIQLWITDSSAPNAIDLIESKVVLLPDAVYVRNNITLSANESVYARSNTAGCVIRIDGYENNRLG